MIDGYSRVRHSLPALRLPRQSASGGGSGDWLSYTYRKPGELYGGSPIFGWGLKDEERFLDLIETEKSGTDA